MQAMCCVCVCLYPCLGTLLTIPSLPVLFLQWAEALAVFLRAADLLGLESRKSLWGQFWSAHQRFFKYLCIAAKVRRLVELANKELADGKVSSSISCRNKSLPERFVFNGSKGNAYKKLSQVDKRSSLSIL